VQLTAQPTKDELPVDGVLTYRLEGIEQAETAAIGTEPTRRGYRGAQADQIQKLAGCVVQSA